MANRTINDVRNPRWGDVGQTMVDLEVDFDELDEVYVVFTAKPTDPESWGRDLYQRAIDGEFGTIGDYAPPEAPEPETAVISLRNKRNAKLAETDYIEIPSKWNTLTAEKQAEWTAYRNALRDVPANNPNVSWTLTENQRTYELTNVNWPTMPE